MQGFCKFGVPRLSLKFRNAAIKKTFGYIYAAGGTLTGGSDKRGSLSLHPGIFFSSRFKDYHV
jgi:hypothetical protein